MIRLPFVTIFVALACSLPLSAQLRLPGEPASQRAALSASVPVEVLPAPDVEAYLLEDEVRGPWPLRYGAVIPVGRGIEDAGVWDAVDAGGSLVWRLQLSSPGAHTLGLLFDEYNLPVGSELYLYDPERRQVLGAYTELNNKLNGQLAIEPVVGDTVVIEYVQPSWVTEAPRLRVGEVVHDYRGLFSLAGGGVEPPGGSCLIDINCPAGDEYQDVKRSVFRTLAGGGLCSASLVNNTAEDGTPYMLTANHCGNMNNAVFLFNYELAGCGFGGASTSDTLSGATKLASTALQDSQLYELSVDVPADFHPYFAGWDRTASPSTTSAATIGHGGGDPKVIAVDADGAVPAGDFWEVGWTEGLIIGGNSGGPLFDGDLRVIGPACCVNIFECDIQLANYGRFDRFWTQQALAPWLDPLGSGALTLDGLDPHPPTPVAPTVASVVPAQIQVVESPMLTVSGTELHTVTAVTIGADPVPFFTADEGSLQFPAPPAVVLGPADIVVSNSVGSASVAVEYVETSPPIIEGLGVSFTAIPFQYEMWAGEEDLFLVRSALTPATFPFGGYELLFDSFKVGEGQLDPLGRFTFSIMPSPFLAGMSVWTQVLFVDEGSMGFAGASNTVETFFLF